MEELLGTERYSEWHLRDGAAADPSILHSYLNYHAEAVELTEHYLQSVMAVYSQLKESFGK